MKLRILIADDEPLIRADLKEILDELGYQVIAEAKDGDEVISLIDKEKPDIAILDIKMPGMDGLEVAAKISHLYPVIILTAYTETQLIERARKAGVMAYITKPFSEKDIYPAIELAVNHFLQRSALAERVTRLQEQLEDRRLIEKAKGLLMSKEGLNEVKAYRYLQKVSMDKNRSMRDVAEAIILMLE